MDTTKDESRLLALMNDALSAGLELKHFSEKNISAFSGDDDKRIQQVLDGRGRLISALTDLEKEIELVAGGMEGGLPGEDSFSHFYELRRSLRRTLDSVEDLDREATALMEEKMRYYRSRTVSARNKKHISAYISSGTPDTGENRFDYIK